MAGLCVAACMGAGVVGCGSDAGGGASSSPSPSPSSSSRDGAAPPTPSLSGDGGVPSTTPTSSGTLTFVIHDFKLYDPNDPSTNPDFENVPKTDANGNPDPSYLGPWDDRGIVEPTLGADSKPVYRAGAARSLTTHGKATFDQWYHDVPGTNVRIEVPFSLTQYADGSFGYDSQVSGVPLSSSAPEKQFLPIDDGTPYASPFGSQGDPHNYSFTCEVHTIFTYRGGEYLHYRGDDDVWVFIDGKRVIDLGGIHDPETGDVALDSLGLTKGQDYPLDFFFAERHKWGSNVLFTTSLALRPVTK